MIPAHRSLSSESQASPGTPFLGPGNCAPGEGTVPLLPGEALTGVLAGSGPCLRVRELETKAKGSRKGKKDNVFPPMCQIGKPKPREAK